MAWKASGKMDLPLTRDGREWDGDVEWPALLRRLDRLSPGYRD